MCLNDTNLFRTILERMLNETSSGLRAPNTSHTEDPSMCKVRTQHLLRYKSSQVRRWFAGCLHTPTAKGVRKPPKWPIKPHHACAKSNRHLLARKPLFLQVVRTTTAS